MSLIINIIYFIGAIALLIIIHEIGHFLAARFFKIEVEEFGLGFPPKALTMFKAKGTEFTLNWIPLGGFVRPKGENDPTVEGGLAAAKPWTRIAVLLAGPLMNFFAGILIFAAVSFINGSPIRDKIVILEVEPNSPAANARIQENDIIYTVNGTLIDSQDSIIDFIHNNLGTELEFVLDRDGELINTTMTPRTEWPEEQGPTGIVLGHPTEPVPITQALQSGTYAVIDYIKLLFSIPGQLISGEITPDQGRLVGYTGMYKIYDHMRTQDAQTPSGLGLGINTLVFFGTITISLGLLNLLPIPALDGGRILFTLPEILFGKRIPQEYENMVNLVGFMLLIIMMVYVNLQDIINPISIP
ncbi:MAG: site-2 protease family protein [Chloroflexi bacterium]|jgi:regulator of sigma E protease|nr:site-2 protease family protein [Chloroflexota bacterium]MBT4003906.1 site-2 protease family protein [Chloroflexota bacterium]MBT4305809.1 site-2 protease family protein [Chloroflexota bacterium]MBT4533633.1 site-2 protease family protein [Chloroflexota bacterium]MBT4681724.1 site-2 protease family protein [Chloroflexota bacterium]